jgi:RNA polymerase sigma-70 factor (ECF subfamily)
VILLDENLTTEFSICIVPMIDALPEKYKQAITLSEIEGISQKDLAKNLNISYSGAKSRVQRGREMLKSLLQECCKISTDTYGNITKYKIKNCNNNCN